MTASEQPPAKKRAKIEPEPGGQLEQLLIAFREAKDRADTAAEEAGEYKQAVKGYLLSLFPDGTGLPGAFDITGDPHGRYPGYTMTLKGGFRLDTARFKAEQSEAYAAYLTASQPSWEFRESAQGRGRG